jgi:hypothetical protein
MSGWRDAGADDGDVDLDESLADGARRVLERDVVAIAEAIERAARAGRGALERLQALRSTPLTGTVLRDNRRHFMRATHALDAVASEVRALLDNAPTSSAQEGTGE